MKKLLLIGATVATLALLIGFAIPALAHGPWEGETTPADQENWEAMHEACEAGDWEAMAETAKEIHGDDFSYMPCYDESYDSSEGDHPGNWWGGMGGHMGGSWGNMMNW